jgi:ectoine hydroxylase-related dioxygenase (phytanoyl-CoA dioxygenase family)
MGSKDKVKIFDFEKQCIEALRYFDEQGYVVLGLNLPDVFINKLVLEMNNEAQNPGKLNPKIFHYNGNPRVIEFWRRSRLCAELSKNDTVMEFARLAYRRDPLPFSTINFIGSTEQPLHSDAIHFGSYPAGMLLGAWVALEDINVDAGPLVVIPGSHKWPEIHLEDMNLCIPKSPEELKSNYTVYENTVRNLVEKSAISPVTALLPKGTCLLWDSNMLHGATKVKNPALSRFSQVTHYHFSGCDYYNPLYSLRTKGKIAKRNISQSILV